MASIKLARLEPFENVLVVTLPRFEDERGWFMEAYREDAFQAAGVATRWVQDNHSFSAEPGTLRGLHYQAPPRAQAKLVRCTRGRVFDAVVDAREASPTYGAWASLELDAAEPVALYVPEGFLHGFQALTPACEVVYKVSEPYSAEHDGSVRWDDPALGVAWPLCKPILSDKDRRAPTLAEARPFPGGADPT